MDGFGVNVDALKTAGLSTAELMAILSETQVEDVDCDGAAVGHDGLAGQLGELLRPLADRRGVPDGGRPAAGPQPD